MVLTTRVTRVCNSSGCNSLAGVCVTCTMVHCTMVHVTPSITRVTPRHIQDPGHSCGNSSGCNSIAGVCVTCTMVHCTMVHVPCVSCGRLLSGERLPWYMYHGTLYHGTCNAQYHMCNASSHLVTCKTRVTRVCNSSGCNSIAGVCVTCTMVHCTMVHVPCVSCGRL